MEKVLVGMSGGVDSTTAVLLLQKAGYEVEGLTLCLHNQEADMQDARHSAIQLGIRHTFLPLSDVFMEEVIRPFAAAYLDGKTPNPCVRCNARVKIASMIRYADEHGFNYIATGHYARIIQKDGLTFLRRGANENKDQTYFLSQIPRAWLKRLILPLGDLSKSEVRQKASEASLSVAQKPDSLDICFIPNNNYTDFINETLAITPKEGRILDQNGYTVGFHNGIHNYTIGQRKGLGAFGKKVYVTDIDAASNTVTIGENDALFSTGLFANTLNSFLPSFPDEIKVHVKIRSAAPCVSATCKKKENDILIYFDEPQRAVTPGQTVAIYQDDVLIGGATIVSRLIS